MNFYVAGISAWDPGDIQNIDRALEAAMSDNNLNNVMMQYFANQPITSRFLASTRLAGDAPSVVSEVDAAALIRALDAEGMLRGVDASSTVVNLLLPRGTILTLDESSPSSRFSGCVATGGYHRSPIPREDAASSEDGLGGYHGSVPLMTDGAAGSVYYAIGVYSEVTADGRAHGIPAFPDPWKSIVATFYHELNEVRTDPDVDDAIRQNRDNLLGWISDQGEECGDFPIDESSDDLSLVFREVPLAEGCGTVPVQFQYSNAVHGPEGPIAQPHRALR